MRPYDDLGRSPRFTQTHRIRLVRVHYTRQVSFGEAGRKCGRPADNADVGSSSREALKSVVRRALAMATGEQYLRLTIQLALIVVISRLLTPDEIGISVIGTGIMAIVLGLREFATSDFLIQRQEVVQNDIRASFTVVFALTALITVAVFLFSPGFASFYGEEKLARFLRLAAIGGLIEALSLPVRGLLRRDMAFGTLAFINTTAATVTAATTILLALAGFSFMSFAWAMLAASCTTTLLSFYCRPDLSFLQPSV